MLISAKRFGGVRVRFLIDACYNELPCRSLCRLMAAGLILREYHPPSWLKPCRSFRRLHDKLLIVDGTVMIVGGRNLAAQYFGLSQSGSFRDRDVLVCGPAAHHAAIYFERTWCSDDVKHIPDHVVKAIGNFLFGPPSLRKFKRFCDRLHACPAKCEAIFPREAVPCSNSKLSPMEVPVPGRELLSNPFDLAEGSVRFLHSDKVVKGCPDITDELIALIASARRRVVIETPYLIPSDRMYCGLRQAAARGVCVQITTNSMATTNKPLAQAGYISQRRKLVASQISLWESQRAEVLHSKTWVVDDTVVIGSYNLDSRSEQLDTQTAVLIRDARVAEALLTVMTNERTANAVPIDANGRPLVRRRQRQVQPVRAIGTPAMRLISPFIWPQL